MTPPELFWDDAPRRRWSREVALQARRNAEQEAAASRDREEFARLIAETRALIHERGRLLKFRVDQLRAPAGAPGGGRWIAEGAQVVPAFVPPPIWGPAIALAATAAAAFFAWLSGRNGPGRRAAISFRAQDFRPGAEHPEALAQVGWLDRDKVREVCPRLEEVQQRTDLAAAQARRDSISPSPQTYGTAVHTNLKQQIDAVADPDFRAEESFLKGQQEVPYGAKGSIRVDVFERVGNGTACVYDIKTGESELSLARMRELAANVYLRYPYTDRIVVTQVRPSQ